MSELIERIGLASVGCVGNVILGQFLYGSENRVGLEERHLTDYKDFSFVEHTEVDFNKVNHVLSSERQIGLDYLSNAINS